jgi:hypothetical protein
MPVRFLKNASELADVSMESPLPVQVTNARPVPADTLLIATTSVTTDANRDLLGSTAAELPTLDNCGQYRKLVWFYFRAGGDSTSTTRVLARATDLSGVRARQRAGRRPCAQALSLPGGANPNWGRLDIPSAGDGYYDQYRIEVSVTAGSSNYILTSKIVGVR